jgi:hypothetical protein
MEPAVQPIDRGRRSVRVMDHRRGLWCQALGPRDALEIALDQRSTGHSLSSSTSVTIPVKKSTPLSNITATIAPGASLDKALIYPREVRLLALKTRGLSPNTSARRASGGVLWFLGCLSHWLRWRQVPIDWGQSIYQFKPRGKFCLSTLTKR